MARVQYGGGVSEFRGSIAGTTFSKNKSGNIARTRRVCTQAMSIKQQDPLAVTSSLIQIWQNLNPYYIGLWNAFAALHPRIDMFGRTKTLSGYQFYLATNSNLILAGQSVITSPPADYTLPSVISGYFLEWDDIDWVEFEILEVPAGETWVLYTGPPCCNSQAFQANKLRLTCIFPEETPIGPPWKADYSASHHVDTPASYPSNYVLWGHMYAIKNSNGANNYGTSLLTEIVTAAP